MALFYCWQSGWDILRQKEWICRRRSIHIQICSCSRIRIRIHIQFYPNECEYLNITPSAVWHAYNIHETQLLDKMERRKINNNKYYECKWKALFWWKIFWRCYQFRWWRWWLNSKLLAGPVTSGALAKTVAATFGGSCKTTVFVIKNLPNEIFFSLQHQPKLEHCYNALPHNNNT